VVRRVIEPSKFLVAELLVETGRLKAERVEPSRVTAAVARAGFCPSHQLAPDAAAAQLLGDPEIPYEEPPAISLAGEPRNDSALVPDENSERKPRRMLRPPPLIEGLQSMRKNLDIRFGRIVFDREPISGSQPERGTTAHSAIISQGGAVGGYFNPVGADAAGKLDQKSRNAFDKARGGIDCGFRLLLRDHRARPRLVIGN